LRERSLLTQEQMLEMQRAGFTFGSHSLTHAMLTSLTDDELQREVHDSKKKLEDLLGVEVKWFAYPYGDVDRRVRAAVQEAGYKAAVTTDVGSNRWQDFLVLNRLDINDRDWLLDFACKLSTGRDYRKSVLRRIPGFGSTAKR
jgi:peptidoglycan/xylan/chitin deacetylase (PgdA/CDA1 family)